MGAGLHAAFPVFAEAFDEVCGLVDPALRVRVLGGEPLDDTRWAQAGLFALEVALARLLADLGVRPAVVAGHSVGELAAAHVAGVLALPDAARLVAARARLMAELPAGGAMVALDGSEARVADLIAGHADVALAAVNSGDAVVVSGATATVEALAERWRLDGGRATRLRVSHAFHSPLVDPMLAEYAEVARSIDYRPPVVPLVSTLTGGPVTDEVAGPDHWVDQARRTVRYHDAARALRAHGVASLLEVGPDGPLAALADDVPAAATLRPRRDDATTFVTALAHAWAHGAPVDWSRHHPPRHRRVDLPTYPFQHQRFWPAAPAASVADWRYRIAWVPLDDTEPGAGNGATPTLAGRRWLVLTSPAVDPDLADWCRRALATAGAEVTLTDVTTGAEPGDATPDGVLSLLGTDEAAHPDHPSVTTGLVATLSAIQDVAGARAGAGAEGVTRLWCLTRGAVGTGADDPIARPAQAPVWGLGRVAGLEHPDRWGGLVDLPDRPDRLDPATAAALVATLAAPPDHGEDQVAVRDGHRLARRLERAPEPGPEPAGAARGWVPTGTALVTGGTGALGAHVARWLAANGAEHLLLVGRRGPDAPGAAELVAELEAAGAGVTVVAADVADRDALAAALAEVPPDRPLRTVVHAAGVGADRPLADLDPAGLADAAAAKVLGARHLDELTSDVHADVERFVVFSSAAGVWGGAAQGAYAAANAAVDALVEHRRARGRPATSVAWGPWSGRGMAGGGTGEQLRRRGVREMAAEPATRALAQALAHDEAAVTVADIDWELFAPSFAAARRRPLLDGVPEAARAQQQAPAAADGAAGADLARRLAALGGDESRRAVLEVVRAEVAVVLGHRGPDDVEPERAFKDLGFDSVTAVELRNRLAAVTGLRLPATSVFDYPTPAALAGEITGRLVPAGGGARTPAGVALDHLAQVEAALGALSADDEAEVRLGLRRLLGRLPGRAAGAARAEGTPAGSSANGGGRRVEDQLDDADDDELFAFIERELGTGEHDPG
jgi:acyl transferase domain-containing protein